MAMHQANRDFKNAIVIITPCLLFLLVVFGYIVTEIIDSLWFKPWLLAAGIYYWTLYSPKTTPIWFALILGLFEDGLSGTPFGLYGFGIILMHYLTTHQRQSLIHSPSTVVFTGFLINLFVVYFIMAIIMWGIGLPQFVWVAMSWFTTSIMFLPISLFFCSVRKRMMKD